MRTPNPAKNVRRFAAWLALLLTSQARAVIFDSTASATHNTTAPGGALAGSGWQWQGVWAGGLGTAIAPDYFITAAHLGGSVGNAITLAGVPYVTTAFHDDPLTDLRIWKIAGAFPSYAPLYTRTDETGRDLVVFGRGSPRGGNVTLGGELKGYFWGSGSNVTRWGTNRVAGTFNVGGGLGDLLYANFNRIGGDEAHLSPGDSGGGVFIQDPADSQWKLAGINYGVDGPFYSDALGNGGFYAALFDTSGYYYRFGASYLPVTGPSSFYSSRISSSLGFIYSAVPEPADAGVLMGMCMLAVALLDGRRRMRPGRAG